MKNEPAQKRRLEYLTQVEREEHPTPPPKKTQKGTAMWARNKRGIPPVETFEDENEISTLMFYEDEA